jgi:elongation factor Ts
MAVTAAQVKELRERTSAGMMDCKKALTETDGDMDKAVEWLQIKGLAQVQKRAGREATEGYVASFIDGGLGVLVEINSETDFVARNTDFRALCAAVAQHIVAHKPADVDALATQPVASAGNKPFKEFFAEKAAQIGENLVVRRFELFSLDGAGVLNSYVHHDGKTGVMIQLNAAAPLSDADAATTLAKQLCMHVTASKPEAIDSSSVDAAEIDKQRSIFAAQARESGKPENIIAKMTEGRVSKWLKEICLLDQPFIVDPDKTVAVALKDTSKAAGAALSVARFVRFTIGENAQAPAEEGA